MDEIWYVEPDAVMKEAARSPYEKTEMTEHPGTGHRQRVRDRFVKENGLDSFQEHEVLEMLLFYAKPRGDTKGIAKDLLENFGNLKGVLEARPEQLQTVKGVGESQAVFISMMLPLTRYCQKMEMTNPKQIANRHDLEAYCKSMLMGRRVEEFHVICVDAQCRVLGTRRVSEGSLSEVNAYPRLVMESALAYNAHSVFFCHNHPGGTCGPSPEDITTTLQLQRALKAVGIAVLDHMIIAGDRGYSMAAHGDVDFGLRGGR